MSYVRGYDMALPKETSPITEEDYLEFDRQSEAKHEFVNGEIVAMAGASLRHNIIVSNTITALNNLLIDSPCIVNPSDMRVKALAMTSYRYPDISVVCEEPQLADDNMDILLNPVLLIEVLSDSTAMEDRVEKFREYRSISSLREYVLISQHEARIERYYWQKNEAWLYFDVAGLENSIELSSLSLRLALLDVYRKVRFDSDENAP